MAAWVIRQEREGEPTDAFQLEQIEVPQPGAFEVIVRVMAAGVNFNNVWAALGKPVSVFGYGDHPEYGHHIGGSDASGVVWKVGEGVTRWKPGDEVVVHCNQASYEDVEVHGLDPLAAPSQKIWGYETTWGSFAQFTKVQAQQLLPRPQNLSWAESSAYGLTYFTAYRMLIDQCKLQAGNNVLIWGAAGGLGVFATQLCAASGANAVGVVSSDEKGELVKQLGAVDYINRAEFGEMMRTPENLTDPAHMIMPKHVLSSITGAQLSTSDFANGKGVVGSGPYTLTVAKTRRSNGRRWRSLRSQTMSTSSWPWPSLRRSGLRRSMGRRRTNTGSAWSIRTGPSV
jgi:crotonyl-CoA carboxylase/reductase